ncbi:hypothetical protein [Jiangella muralis]|nr:hypothetical protein [Jiangella muralis]
MTTEPPDEVDALHGPRLPYRRPAARLVLPPGVTSTDLLDRDDRV